MARGDCSKNSASLAWDQPRRLRWDLRFSGKFIFCGVSDNSGGRTRQTRQISGLLFPAGFQAVDFRLIAKRILHQSCPFHQFLIAHVWIEGSKNVFWLEVFHCGELCGGCFHCVELVRCDVNTSHNTRKTQQLFRIFCDYFGRSPQNRPAASGVTTSR